MAEDKGYNGWSNYETWNVKLWIDNDEGSYSYWREETQRCWEEADRSKNRSYATQTRKECTACMLADILKDEHEQNTPETVGVYADLLNAALSEVDWYEIAESLIEAEEFEEDEEVA